MTATTPVEVSCRSGEAYGVRLRDHNVGTDQPRGGRRSRPGPGSRAAGGVHGLVRVAEGRPAVRVAAWTSERHETALLAAVRHRTAHNTLRRAPEIVIELNEVES
ncbi:hypothetical protein [Saccharothrix sp. NRRL B-16314]|uniref:hypothetical protein n=1 Tax=Saccharothrix sp. NRRL B-16314 TaxID=1463825 RepID=UPI000525F6B5|nr:hypothetical protein [Saccharothrix sp. NRRL B-16314]